MLKYEMIDYFNNNLLKAHPLVYKEPKKETEILVCYSENGMLSCKVTEDYFHLYIHDHEILHTSYVDLQRIKRDGEDRYYLNRLIRIVHQYIKYRDCKKSTELLRDLTKDTQSFYNYVNILNDAGVTAKDNPLVYDQEGFCSTKESNHDYVFMLYKEHGFLEVSFKSHCIYAIKEYNVDLDEFAESVKNGMIEYTEEQIQYHNDEIAKLKKMGEIYNERLSNA